MFRKMSKGQGAMEYLMTYGWAILVVMIVGIVMWQLGIFNLGQGSTTSTGFSKIKPQLSAAGVTPAGVVNFMFTNGEGASIIASTMHIISGAPGSASCTTPSAYVQNPSGTAITIQSGDNLIFKTQCLGTGQAGDVYNARVTLNYQVVVAGVTSAHTEVGTIRGTRE